MQNLALPSRPPRHEPLSDDDRRRAIRVAERLHADLSRLVGQLPEPARHASGMSRHLGIVRNTCQRVVAALQNGEPGTETLVRLPGVKGLEQFVDAMRRRGVPAADADMAESAVRQFDRLIADLAGSHARLAARIRVVPTGAVAGGLGSPEARARLYEAAVGVIGRALDTHVSVYAFRHTAANGGTLERALAHGQFGTTVAPGGMPVTLMSGHTLEWIGDDDKGVKLLDDSSAKGLTPKALLEPFTTRPLPTVTSRGDPGNLVQVIDPAGLDAPIVFDVATAERTTHPISDPATGRPTLDEVWTLINAPTRRLVFDVFLHTSIERMYRPSADALLWLPRLTVPGGDRWITRFPDQPALEMLGRGLERSPSKRHARHAEFTEFFFRQLAWDPGEFVGFRVETDFPVWRGGYCIRFERVAPRGIGEI